CPRARARAIATNAASRSPPRGARRSPACAVACRASPAATPAGCRAASTAAAARTASSGSERQDRLRIIAAYELAALEDLALGEQGLRLLDHRAAVGLEHDPFARTPAAGVHRLVEAHRELVAVEPGVELGPQVDVVLRPAQRGVVLAHVRD